MGHGDHADEAPSPGGVGVILNLASAKGGQGTSTLAAAIALGASRRQPTALISARDGALICNVANRDTEGGWVDHPHLVSPDQADFIVSDEGGYPGIEYTVGQRHHQVLNLLVIQPCYLAVTNVIRRHWSHERPTGFIFVNVPNRALCSADVAMALGMREVERVRWSDDVARCVDAGLLVGAHSIPNHYRQSVEGILNHIGVTNPYVTKEQVNAR